MARMVRLTFQPEGRLVEVPAGSTVLEAAHLEGLVLKSPCGGHGTCGQCRVVMSRGAVSPTPVDKRHISRKELRERMRLACQARVYEDARVIVPQETRVSEQKILETGITRKVRPEPAVVKHYLEVPRAELPDQRSDLERLLGSLPTGGGRLEVPLEILRSLPHDLRRANYRVTVAISASRLLGIEPGNTTRKLFGLAFDIGTTTVVGSLVDLVSGRELRTASRTNPQVAFGDDVISRIEYASTHKDGLERLNAEIMRAVNEIIGELCADVAREKIYEATVVGNSTMTHLFLKIPPRYLGQAPYVSTYKGLIETSASEVGLEVNPASRVVILPNIAGFVGADTVGVILASGLHKSRKLRMAIDIGTNTEIVLGTRERLLAVSCAAGPAFEGVRIKFGMRACPGAIERVSMNEDVSVSVIGNRPGSGICGSGIIDAIGELLRLGIIDRTGFLRERKDLASLPKGIRRRAISDSDGNMFVLLEASRTESGKKLYITQRDVRQVQLAKAAIHTGVQVLKKELDVEDEDISEVYLAGGFGNFVRKEQAMRLGILPDVPLEKVKFIGNAAHSGAKLALLSKKMRREAEKISAMVRYVELAGRPDFQETFSDSLFFTSANTSAVELSRTF